MYAGTPAISPNPHVTHSLVAIRRLQDVLRSVPHLPTPTTSDMADIHPLNDYWPEKLPYEKQSLIVPGSGKPGHSGASLTMSGPIQAHGNNVLQMFTGMASPYIRAQRSKIQDV